MMWPPCVYLSLAEATAAATFSLVRRVGSFIFEQTKVRVKEEEEE
jgi:hypothetical protein